jgi:hypothetical protein
LGKFDVEFEDLVDWHGYFLWQSDPRENEATDEDRYDTLRHLQSQWDE